jgi:hypothetical protein
MKTTTLLTLILVTSIDATAQDYVPSSLDSVTPAVRDGAVNWCRRKMARDGKPFDASKPESSCSVREMLLGYSRERESDLKRRNVKPTHIDVKVEADRINKARKP